jgi:integrase/recombinase XerD
VKFETAKSNYLNHLRIERGLAENTLLSYSRDLGKLGEYLQANHLNFDQLKADDVVKFEVTLKSSGLTLSSINRVVSCLKGFYKYCNIESSVHNPMLESLSHKLPRKLPKALSIDEVTRLIESAKRVGDLMSPRDFAILELLYSTGGRVSEIIGINTTDLSITKLADDEISVLKLKGKGSKERFVPLGKYAVTALEEYLVRTRPALAEKNNRGTTALFLNSRGGRLSRQSAWQIVLDAADATGLSGRVSPHVFRHSYATHLLDGGADIRVVQELLGHSSVTTTQIYTLITIDKVRESYSSAHPRAK